MTRARELAKEIEGMSVPAQLRFAADLLESAPEGTPVLRIVNAIVSRISTETGALLAIQRFEGE